MKFTIFLSVIMLAFLLNKSVCSQSKKDFNGLKKQFENLREFNNGKIKSKTQKYLDNIDKEIFKILNANELEVKLPIYLNLYRHVRYSYLNMIDSACICLNRAKNQYDKINTLSDLQATEQKNIYAKVGINPSSISGIETNFIKKGHNCSDIIPKIEPAKIINSEGSNNPSDSTQYLHLRLIHDDPMAILLKSLSEGYYDTKNLNFRELSLYDDEFIKYLNDSTRQFLITFKTDDLYDVFLFDIGEYTLDNFTAKSPKFRSFRESLDKFKKIILQTIDKYGNSAYEIYLIGSADVLSVNKKLISPYNTNVFKEINVYKINHEEMRYDESSIKIQEFYNNSDLPELRAMYVKFHLLEKPSLKKKQLDDKIHIIKGYIYNKVEKLERKCQIVFVIYPEIANKIVSDHKK